MPSQRNNLKEKNVNGSKNTRMDFSNKDDMDYRKDELMHIGRYWNAVKTMIDLSSKLKRPIKVLDIGCGELNPVKMFSSAVAMKKDTVIDEYIGVDIDEIMANNNMKKHEQMFKTCKAKYLIQDLTTNSRLPFDDDTFDCIFCFEFVEHIKQEFLPEIIKETSRLLKKDGIALFSTPNSNGSNEKLPKDHIYEYSYEELISIFNNNGYNVFKTRGVCINITKIPKDEQEKLQKVIDAYYTAFGRSTPFASVALAPMFNPKNCKNVIYHLRKKVK